MIQQTSLPSHTTRLTTISSHTTNLTSISYNQPHYHLVQPASLPSHTTNLTTISYNHSHYHPVQPTSLPFHTTNLTTISHDQPHYHLIQPFSLPSHTISPTTISYNQCHYHLTQPVPLPSHATASQPTVRQWQQLHLHSCSLTSNVEETMPRHTTSQQHGRQTDIMTAPRPTDRHHDSTADNIPVTGAAAEAEDHDHTGREQQRWTQWDWISERGWDDTCWASDQCQTTAQCQHHVVSITSLTWLYLCQLWKHRNPDSLINLMSWTIHNYAHAECIQYVAHPCRSQMVTPSSE